MWQRADLTFTTHQESMINSAWAGSLATGSGPQSGSTAQLRKGVKVEASRV